MGNRSGHLSSGMWSAGDGQQCGTVTRPLMPRLLSDAGREIKERIESLTDDLAAPTYDSLKPSELDQLIADLEPISAALDAAGSR